MDEKKFVTDGEFFSRNQRKIVIHVKLLELSPWILDAIRIFYYIRLF